MPRIYVADLAAYTAGYLFGAWIDLGSIDRDELADKVLTLLANGRRRYGRETLSNHEEYAIHDYEGFGGIRIPEYASLEYVIAVAEGVNEHGDAFGAFVSYSGLDADNALAVFSDAYIGEMTVLDYAYDYIESTGEVDPDSTLGRYFDYEKFAHDLEVGGDVVETGGYLFYGNW